MQRKPRFTPNPKQLKDILRRLKKGEFQSSIAESYDTSQPNISRIAKRYLSSVLVDKKSIKPPIYRTPILSDDDVFAIYNLIQQVDAPRGQKTHEFVKIGLKFGVTPGCVYHIAFKRGRFETLLKDLP